MNPRIPREWVDTSDKKLFRQCVLSCGDKVTITWVPVKLAKKGSKVTVDDWDGVWTIESVSETALNGSIIGAMQEAHKHHRKRTDI